jgi:SNF2 family DNA or RNA helicase
LLIVSFKNGRTIIKVKDPDFWDDLAQVKLIPGRKYLKGYWIVDPKMFGSFMQNFPKDKVKYEAKEWQCLGRDPETAEDKYGIPVDEIGREFMTDDVDKVAYQDVGASFLFYRKRAILADEVGLGKTIESFLLIGKGVAMGAVRQGGGHVLVLTKKGLVHSYVKEALEKTKFTVIKARGTTEKREELWQRARQYDIVVAGHEQLRSDMDFDYMMDLDLDLIIVDEIHKFNNRSTKLHKQLDALLKKQKTSRLAGFSATPVTGNPIVNLYDLMRLVNKEVLGNVKEFEGRYIKHQKCTRKDGRVFWKSEPKLELLGEIKIKTAPYLMQRSCADVGLKKPEVIPVTQYIEMSSDQKRLTDEAWEGIEFYSQKIDDLNAQMEREQDPNKKYGIKMAIERVEGSQKSFFTYLRMLADGMEMLKASTSYAKYLKNVRSWRTPKLELLEDILPDILATDKVVMHTDFEMNFPVVLPFIEKKMKVGVLHVDGSMPPTCSKPEDLPCGKCTRQNNCNMRRRQEWMFKNDDRYRVIFMTSAGEEGMNLQNAKYQINYDIPWNPKSLEQRKGRINRYKSEHETQYVIDMISIDSIEEVIFDRVITRKRSQTEQLIRSTEDELAYIKELSQQIKR